MSGNEKILCGTVSSQTLYGQGTIVACCREPDEAYQLNEFINSLDSKSQRRVQILQLDLQHQSSIQSTGKQIRNQFQRVDMLLNVAGILGDGRTTPGPERSLSNMDREWFEKTIAVNLLAPVFLTKELLPLIKQKRKASTAEQRPKAVIVNLSARVGSISDNELGGWYSYRVSKTALNQATRTLAHELKRHSAWAVALHPGTTNTDLSKPFQQNVKEGSLFPVEFTVTQLLNIIDSLQDVNSGGFYDWSGRAISF
jgi:NAD(P)-dependent dehydrogenase (short-subunit alcohol dehydrogenase family)